MFCPNCHTEYLEGYQTCADCGADLVPELLPRQDNQSREPMPLGGPVPVYESYILPNIALAKSILDGAGINFITQNEVVDAYIVGGPAIIQVGSDDAEHARELLSGLDDDHPVTSGLEFGDLSGDDTVEPPTT